MSSFDFVAVLLLLAAILGIVNHRYLHLPRTIALMAGSLLLSITVILVDRSVASVELRQRWGELVATTDLPHVFLDGLLAFMLFAGSLHVDMDSLCARKWTVLSLATLGVLMATGLYGFGIWLIFGGTIPLPWCFTLGALLAPTDPIAVGGPAAGSRPALMPFGGRKRRKPVQRRCRGRGVRRRTGMGQWPRYHRTYDRGGWRHWAGAGDTPG